MALTPQKVNSIQINVFYKFTFLVLSVITYFSVRAVYDSSCQQLGTPGRALIAWSKQDINNCGWTPHIMNRLSLSLLGHTACVSTVCASQNLFKKKKYFSVHINRSEQPNIQHEPHVSHVTAAGHHLKIWCLGYFFSKVVSKNMWEWSVDSHISNITPFTLVSMSICRICNRLEKMESGTAAGQPAWCTPGQGALFGRALQSRWLIEPFFLTLAHFL